MKLSILFVAILLISSVSSQYAELKVIVIKGSQSESLLLSTLDTTLAASSLYNSSLKTVIFFHGYIASYTRDPSLKEIPNALETLGGYNVLVGDWSSYNIGLFSDVAGKVEKIADLYGEKFADMITAGGMKLKNWHFIGHSLGAHMSGGIARKIKSTSPSADYVVRRVTGLDPAGLLIYPNNILHHTLPTFKPLVSTDGKNTKKKESRI